MRRSTAVGRGSARKIPVLIIGVLIIGALAAGGFVVVGAGAPGESPERIGTAELLKKISTAPENAPDFRATVVVDQTVLPEGLMSASSGDAPGASGPRSARIWYGGPDALRAELQGETGDRVLVRNGSKVSVYDGAANSVRTGEKPQSATPLPEATASPEEINEFLDEISPTSRLQTDSPVVVAGRWAYPLTLTPQDDRRTLVERAEAFVDAETFLPLSFELYADDAPEPVARYNVRDFEVGAVPEERFEFETPPGAEVLREKPPSRDPREGATEEPRKVASVEEASEETGFRVRELAEPLGGRKLREIRVVDDGAALIYGEGWGTVILAQKPEQARGDAQAPGGAGGIDGFQVPTRDLGEGVEAREISTPVGSTLSWSADGVSYSLSGSVPAKELREAARGLLAR